MGTVFHTDDVLTTLAEHGGGRLHRLVGKKGQEIRGLFPVFEIRRGPVSTVFSPPPRMGVPNMGPVLLNYEKLKQRKFDRTNRQFVEEALEWIRETIGPKYTRIEAVTDYIDTRPFQWNDFEVTPRHTYEIDLTGGEEAVISQFRGGLRSNIQGCEVNYEVFEGDEDDVTYILRNVAERFEEQGKSYDIDVPYVTDLYRAVPKRRMRPYVGTIEGERVAGIVALEFGERVYFWQGGWKPDTKIPINDLLHWHIICEAIDRGVETYDLTGANTHRLSRYKAKFNPELSPYYEIERGTRVMTLASDIYRRVK